ncbi:MAG: hypothetical protein ACRDOK_24880 [Streptosporangiaceae bacterium]
MSPARVSFAAAAIAVGLAAGWVVPSRAVTFAVLGVGLAVANGYAKAYSP